MQIQGEKGREHITITICCTITGCY